MRLLDAAFAHSGFDALALRADGGLGAAGFALPGNAPAHPIAVRFGPDGTLVASFGSGGIATTPGLASGGTSAHAVGIAGDGLVLGGEAVFFVMDSPSISAAVLERLTATGALDPTFNAGGPIPGRVQTVFGVNEAAIHALRVLGDGRVLVAGWRKSASDRVPVVARFNADGSPDLTFGHPSTPGLRTIPYSGSGVLRALTLDSQGRILVAGTLSLPGPPTRDVGLVARLTPDGLFDATFAAGAAIPGARIIEPSPTSRTRLDAVAADAQDRVVVSGDTNTPGPGTQIFVARLTTAGSADGAFSPDAPAGMLSQAPAGASASRASGVAVGADGLITIAGRATVGALQRLLLARYDPAGAPDAGFSSGGNLVLKAIGNGASLSAGSALLTPSGKLVTGGQAEIAEGRRAFAARYGSLGSGPLASFTVSWPSPSETGAVKNAIRPGQIVTFDSAGTSDSDGSIVARKWDLDGDGSFETTGPTPTKSYPDSGDIGVTLSVADDDGLTAIASQTLRVRANTAPQALAGPPPPGRANPRPFEASSGEQSLLAPALADPADRDFAPVIGRKYAFTGAPSIDHDGTVMRYRWALDRDGVYSEWTTDPEVEHTFRIPGPRTLRLQVQDDEGAEGTWENTVEIPKPSYSLHLNTASGGELGAVNIKPGAKFTVYGRVKPVNDHGNYFQMPRVSITDSAGSDLLKGDDKLSTTVTRTGEGDFTVTISAPPSSPYRKATLTIEAAVPNGFRAEATDKAPYSAPSKILTHKLPLQVIPATQLAINGLEVTQGTSRFDPLYGWFQSAGLRSDPMPYEGMRLAEGKDTFVRLYAVNYFPASVTGVSAVLHGTRNGKPLPGSPLTPIKSPKSVKFGFPVGTAEQLDDWEASYWFRLPYSWAKRKTKIDLRGVITPPLDESTSGVSCPLEGCLADNDLTIKGVEFRPTPILNLLTLYFKFNGTMPSFPDKQLLWGLHRLPIDPLRVPVVPGGLTYESAGVEDDEDDSRELKLHKIAKEIAEELTDDPRVHPHGIVMGVNTAGPSGTSYGTLSLPGPVPGVITIGGQSISVIGHEIGHVFRQDHASACVLDDDGKQSVAPPGNAVYPGAPWPPDEIGRLQGYVYNKLPGPVIRTVAGSPKYDVMSYCANSKATGMSPRNWSIIGDVMANLAGAYGDDTPADFYTPQTGIPAAAARSRRAHRHGAALPLYERGRRAGAAQVAGRSLGVLATVHADGRVSGMKTFPLEPGHKVITQADPAYAAVTRSAAGAVIGRAPVELLEIKAHTGPKLYELRAIVPAAGATRFEIQRNGAAVASVAASAAAPTVEILSPKPGARLPSKGTFSVRARVGDTDGLPLSVRLDWAPDGRSYAPLHMADVKPGTLTLKLPAAQFAGARSGILRLVADDGFSGATTTVRRLRARGFRPMLTIHGGPVAQPVDVPVALRAAAFDDRGVRLTGKRIEWRIGRKRVGRGTAVTLSRLRAGRHVLRVTARDRRGNRTIKRVKVRLQPVAPSFTTLILPSKLSARARSLRIRVASSMDATLSIGRRHFRTGRRARAFRVPVSRGKSALKLRLKLRSGRKSRTVVRVLKRR